MAAEWMTGDATAMVVYRGIGPLVNLVRREGEDGGTVWLEAKQPMSGGQPSQPIKGTAELTAEELLDALRGPLGAG
jgi:hypothetical protein